MRTRPAWEIPTPTARRSSTCSSFVRGAAGVTWEPGTLVDSVVGLGRQFTAGDLDGDGKIDIAVASKHGAFLFFQK